MEELKKAFRILVYAIGVIWLLGLLVRIIGDKISGDILTVAIVFFTGYGIVAFVKKLKEKGK